MSYDDQVAAYKRAMTEAVQAGLNHAIATIADYASGHPLAQPHCDQLAAILRDQCAALGVRAPE